MPQDRIANVQLLGVNDFHGNLESTTRRDLPGKTLGGAAYLDRYEAQNPERTIRIHAGDMVGASPLVDGEPVNTSDPDYPSAAYPYVAANTVYKNSGKTVLPPYKIVKRDGINVGFIGVTTLETPRIVSPTP